MPKRHAVFLCSQQTRLCVESSEAVKRKHDDEEEEGLEGPSSPLCALVGVPAEYSLDDLLAFVGAYAPEIAESLLLPCAEVHYQVAVLQFTSLEAMRLFVQLFSFQHFPVENTFDQICIALPLPLAEFGDRDISSTTADERWKDLPQCPYCLCRLSEATNGIPESSVAVPHVLSLATRRRCRVCQLLFAHLRGDEVQCSCCGLVGNVWACLLCGNCGCGDQLNIT